MKKKSTVAAIIVLFICVAVYLNLNTSEVGGDDVRVQETLNGNAGEVAEEVKSQTYFEEARLEKQKARDSAITTLKESLVGEDVPKESRDRAAKSIENISNGAISETRIETLVKAKGYRDCVTLINDSGVNVIVSAPEGGLTAADTSKIKDIVMSETGVLAGQIKIIEIK